MVDCDTERATDLEHSMLFTELANATDEEEQKRRKWRRFLRGLEVKQVGRRWLESGVCWG